MSDDKYPAYSPFFGAMGAASAMVFSGMFYVLSTFHLFAFLNVDICLFTRNETRSDMVVSGYGSMGY